jgi:hypothetical protein
VYNHRLNGGNGVSLMSVTICMAMERFPHHNLTDAWDKGILFFSLRVSFVKAYVLPLSQLIQIHLSKEQIPR